MRKRTYSVEPGVGVEPTYRALQAYNIGFNINNSVSVKIRNIVKFYTGKELLRLKSIYQKFSKRLRILD